MRDKQKGLRASAGGFNYVEVPDDRVNGTERLASDVTDAREDDGFKTYLVFTYEPRLWDELVE